MSPDIAAHRKLNTIYDVQLTSRVITSNQWYGLEAVCQCGLVGVCLPNSNASGKHLTKPPPCHTPHTQPQHTLHSTRQVKQQAADGPAASGGQVRRYSARGSHPVTDTPMAWRELLLLRHRWHHQMKQAGCRSGLAQPHGCSPSLITAVCTSSHTSSPHILTPITTHTFLGC
jgi:hypothetical protein